MWWLPDDPESQVPGTLTFDTDSTASLLCFTDLSCEVEVSRLENTRACGSLCVGLLAVVIVERQGPEPSLFSPEVS